MHLGKAACHNWVNESSPPSHVPGPFRQVSKKEEGHLFHKLAHLVLADIDETQLCAEEERLVHGGPRAVDVKLQGNTLTLTFARTGTQSTWRDEPDCATLHLLEEHPTSEQHQASRTGNLHTCPSVANKPASLYTRLPTSAQHQSGVYSVSDHLYV